MPSQVDGEAGNVPFLPQKLLAKAARLNQSRNPPALFAGSHIQSIYSPGSPSPFIAYSSGRISRRIAARICIVAKSHA